MPFSARRVSREHHKELSQKGKTVSSEAVSLRFMAQNKAISGEIAPTRYAFVVSGKVAPKAADRNRLKRRGRAILHGLEGGLADGYLCAFFFKKPAISGAFPQLEAEITTVLSKAGLLRP